MKTKPWFRSGLLLLLCVLLVSCATPDLSEESSAAASFPAKESSETVSVPEDPNAKVARAYLEELLANEQATRTVEWLTEKRAEAIRDYVKQLNAPFLTKEDVLRIAEQALAIVAAEQPQSLLLPACGVLAGVVWSPMVAPDTLETFYNALVAYTLYLFTPPDYLFREEEVFEKTFLTSALRLYLPLAGEYSSRLEALAVLQEGKNMVGLYLSGLAGNEHPLDCSFCGTSVLFDAGGGVLKLDLLELAQQWNVELPEEFFTARAEEAVWEWLERILHGQDPGGQEFYLLPDNWEVGMHRLFTTDDVREIRRQVERLPAPILTSGAVHDMLLSLLNASYMDDPLLLLPGFDGKEDVLLPPNIETVEDAMRKDEAIFNAKVYMAAVYLIDLFTPSAFRLPDLMDKEGVYYALSDPGEPVYVLAAKENGLYTARESTGLEPRFITRVPWEE